MSGRWDLGDYGSCVKIGDNLTGVTPGYVPKNFNGEESFIELDFFMLAVTIINATTTKDNMLLGLPTLIDVQLSYTEKNKLPEDLKSLVSDLSKAFLMVRQL
ncbi:queuine tRNA-ribosyltransferase [Acrasis kona]|uniref:Queuine tRNA-ribosyltransferase n=1 Tax=Acrasis kona TaxID=1008807 RepID=A0AAW2YWC4_9EUKA